MKTTVLGTGLLLCGALGVFTANIRDTTMSVSSEAWRSLHRFSFFWSPNDHEFSFPASFFASIEFAYVLIAIGVVFNIWGLTRKDKRSTPTV